MASLHSRIQEREALEDSFEALIAEGTSLSIQAIQENLGPQLVAVQEQIDALQAVILEAEDAVALIINQGLPAASVQFTPAAGIGAVTAQAAFVEVAGDIAALSAATAAALTTKPSLGLTIALGG